MFTKKKNLFWICLGLQRRPLRPWRLTTDKNPADDLQEQRILQNQEDHFKNGGMTDVSFDLNIKSKVWVFL